MAGRDEPLQLFGMMIPQQTEAGTVEYHELKAAGLTHHNPQDTYVILCFQGEMLGVSLPLGAVTEHKVLLTGENAAMLAAIAIVQGERAMGRIPFQACLDQQLMYVRDKTKDEEVQNDD